MNKTSVAQQAKTANMLPPVQGILQRKCACGNHTVAGGECEECAKKKNDLQRKLTIGASNDPLEQEADRVADRLMAAPANSLAGGAATRIQRFTGQATEGTDTAPASVDRVLASSGKGLEPALRLDMEQRFGHDFSQVRIHTGGAAEQSARDVSAQAYTVGRNIVFGAERFAPGSHEGQRLIAHELTHVVQQGGAVSKPTHNSGNPRSTGFQTASDQISASNARVIQRAGDPAAIPPGFPCPTDLTPGAPTGTDVLFPLSGSVITAAHTVLLTTFRDTWVAAGGTDDILVHGYASTDGDQGPNWTLSCDRAQAVRAELIRLGIPAVRINIVAHGESTDFGTGAAANRHSVVTSRSSGVLPLPLIAGTLTARDNFASRSTTSFGVGEIIDLSFGSLPPRPAADFGGLQWFLVSGGGTLVPGLVPNDGTATYTARATAGVVQLELRVATGATAGRVISSHTITIVIPTGVRMTAIPGTAPSFANPGVVPVGTWGAGFQANPFFDPKDVSFRGVMFGEGTVASVVSPAGSFMSPFAGLAHPVGGLGPGGGGNATTGTPFLGIDSITTGQLAPASNAPLLGPICGVSDFLWAIPWEFSVAGGPRTPFAGGATANHHATSTFFCNATIEKAGAGPFCRRIDGTTC